MDLKDIKLIVERGDLLSLQEYFSMIMSGEVDALVEWDYLFQKVYLHACLKKKREIAKWLEKEVFLQLPPIQAIAIRQVFPYGNYLLHHFSFKTPTFIFVGDQK